MVLDVNPSSSFLLREHKVSSLKSLMTKSFNSMIITNKIPIRVILDIMDEIGWRDLYQAFKVKVRWKTAQKCDVVTAYAI
jgi:hypothetical protein